MAYRVEVQVRVGWVPDGAGGAALGQQQANVAGTGTSLAPSTIFNAQVMQGIQAEGVQGGDTPTQAQFQAAITAAASDLNTNFATAANVATWQNWATGNP